jgi:phosphoglycolate phosphatase-like HAD superfamily hydrolase
MRPVILFDFDGTLFFGTADLNFESFNRARDFFGLPPISRELANETVGDTFDQIVEKLFGTLDAEQKRFVGQVLLANTAQVIDETAVLPPDVDAMLAALAARTRLAILSNGNPAYLDKILGRLGIGRHFACIWHFTPGYTKRTAIPEILRQLGASSAVMVGDRQEDVDAGRANGCITVAVKNDFGDSRVDHADHVVFDHAQMKEQLLKILDQAD